MQLALTSHVLLSGQRMPTCNLYRKCSVLDTGKQVPTCTSRLHLDYCTLPVVPLVQDLGVLASNNLCPSTPINDMVAKAYKRAYIFLQLFGRLIPYRI